MSIVVHDNSSPCKPVFLDERNCGYNRPSHANRYRSIQCICLFSCSPPPCLPELLRSLAQYYLALKCSHFHREDRYQRPSPRRLICFLIPITTPRLPIKLVSLFHRSLLLMDIVAHSYLSPAQSSLLSALSLTRSDERLPYFVFSCFSF